jgi:hypothetical protein
MPATASVTRALVGHAGCQAHRGGMHGLPDAAGEVRRRRLLEYLLVAALGRAVPFPEGEHLSAPVAEDLHLHVAGPGHVFLREDAAVLEGALAQAGHALPGRGHLGGLLADLHADAAAAARALEQDGVTDAFPLRQGGIRVRQQVRAGEQRDAAFGGQGPGGMLEAEAPHLGGRGPDEDQARVQAGLGEIGVLGKEAVAGVDGLRPAGLGDGDDAGPVQVALGRRGRTDGMRLVAGGHVEGPGVGLGEYGRGPDAQLPQGAGHPAGDFAPVGDEDLGEHGLSDQGSQISSLIGVGL